MGLLDVFKRRSGVLDGELEGDQPVVLADRLVDPPTSGQVTVRLRTPDALRIEAALVA
ncbi:hypothetical protein [Tenggerimyces flavus]|uniref:Uncharacterized protein n=1 Tax=Tenggerimyces flavus TaxID=1708749 RepID=A0ABV7YCP0_9ACTN|nr:hypothetical protein [Tenggerimyces flavus]MBM7786908.1 hypothetical protein [Tenggerimyces flavus]